MPRRSAKERWTVWYMRCSWLKSTDQVLISSPTQYMQKYSLDFKVFLCEITGWFTGLEQLTIVFGFLLSTYFCKLFFFIFLIMMTGWRGNLSALVPLINEIAFPKRTHNHNRVHLELSVGWRTWWSSVSWVA